MEYGFYFGQAPEYILLEPINFYLSQPHQFLFAFIADRRGQQLVRFQPNQ